MHPELSSFTAIDETFAQTARALFDHIKPPLLLIGEWDAHFENIASIYKWAEHYETTPQKIDHKTALIVTNSRQQYGKIAKRIKSRMAVLVYDESQVIPIKERRKNDLPLVCYLRSVSSRFIRGHVRTLLQLQKSFIGVEEHYPLIVSSEFAADQLTNVVQCLDQGNHVCVVTESPLYFYYVFRTLVQLTHYETVVLVESPDCFEQKVDSAKTTTVILCVSSKKDVVAYKNFDLSEYSIIYTTSKNITPPKDCMDIPIENLGTTNADFYLIAYFQCLQINLDDEANQTRFVQLGDIDRLRAENHNYFEFTHRLTKFFDQENIRFRNIPPRIRGVPIGRYPLNTLLAKLDAAIFKELLDQCDSVLDNAELLSGIRRSTLQAKQSKNPTS